MVLSRVTISHPEWDFRLNSRLNYPILADDIACVSALSLSGEMYLHISVYTCSVALKFSKPEEDNYFVLFLGMSHILFPEVYISRCDE